MGLLMVNGFTFIKTEMFGLNQIIEMELKLAPGLLIMRVEKNDVERWDLGWKASTIGNVRLIP